MFSVRGRNDVARASRPCVSRASCPRGWSGVFSIRLGFFAVCFLAAFALVARQDPRAHACGPFFPNRMLTGGDKALLSAPVADFAKEMDRLVPANPFNFTAVKPERGQEVNSLRQTVLADEEQLTLALAEAETPRAEANRILAEYHRLRGTFLLWADSGCTDGNRVDPCLAAALQWRYRGDANAPRSQRPLASPDELVPKGVPQEFADYLRGALHYELSEPNEARACWRKVLEARGKNRSVWAAYMIAKTYVDSEPNEAIAAFPLVRELAQKGFPDPLGLASESLGWEARAELHQGHYERAVVLYMLQYATGDGTAIWSLRDTALTAFGDDAGTLARLARSAKVRPVLAAFVVARGGPYRYAPADEVTSAWLAAVEAAGVKDLPDADRLAWAAYQIGDMKMAHRWLARAKADSPVANWVRAKLLLREGNLDLAAVKIAKAVRNLPSNEDTWFARGIYSGDSGATLCTVETAQAELAMLKMARWEYAEAMDLLLRHGWWLDAAYVAERVLTTRELVNYVDRHWPGPSEPATRPRPLYHGMGSMAGLPLVEHPREVESPYGGFGWNMPPEGIRYVLGRRLVREGDFQKARAYLPAEWRGELDKYPRSLAVARDGNQPARKRAEAFVAAARVARHKGIELFGTELDPDWHVYGGNFEEPPTAGARADANEMKLVPVTDDEKARVARTAAAPYRRFHYRYVAADLA